MTTVITTASAERRKRLKLKRIVISEQNYHALKRLGYAGDSFNDVISKLLRIEKNCQEKRQQELQQQLQQQESDDRNNSTRAADFLSLGAFLNCLSRIGNKKVT